MFREKRVVTVTDSTSDIPPDLASEHEIKIVPLEVRFDIKKGEIYQDGVDITSAEFFDKLKTSKVHPSTSTPPVGELERTYREILERTRSIFSIHLLDDYSATFKTARMAAENVIEEDNSPKKPDIRVKDSGQVSLGLGIAVLRAAKLAERRRKLPEIEEEIDVLLPRIYTVCVLPTLEFARRGGRLSLIKTARSYVASAFGFVPILKIHQGEIGEAGAVRIPKRIDGLIAKVKKLHEDLGPFEEMAVVHGNCLDDGQRVHEALKDMTRGYQQNVSDLGLFDLGPAIGVHGGPGTVGVSILLRAKT